MSRLPPDAEKPLPDGPWCDEPDREEGFWLGLPYIQSRQWLGHLCGYVAVPVGHPWYEKHYDDISGPRVHGGLTYARACHGLVCHAPRPGESGAVWWLGFDCAHCYDLVPGYSEELRRAMIDDCVYRDWKYVQRQIRRLAAWARRAQGWSLEIIREYSARQEAKA